MALLADKKTTKELENRLSEFVEYGMALYYLAKEGRINNKDLENMFFSNDNEKSSFLYKKIMKKMKPSDLNKAYESYKKEDSNIKDEINYKKELNISYTEKLIKEIENENNDLIDKTYINTYYYLITNIKNK